MSKNPSNKEVIRFKLVKSLNDPRLTVHATGEYVLYRDYKLLVRNMHTQINAYKNKIDEIVKQLERLEQHCLNLQKKKKRKSKNKTYTERKEYLFVKTSYYTSDGTCQYFHVDPMHHEEYFQKVKTMPPTKTDFFEQKDYGWHLADTLTVIKAKNPADLLIIIEESW